MTEAGFEARQSDSGVGPINHDSICLLSEKFRFQDFVHLLTQYAQSLAERQ